MKHSKVRRREFLRIAAAALATTALPALAAGSKTWQMRLALCSVMFSELSVEDFCAQAAKLGFYEIDLWCPFDRCRHLEDAAKRLGAAGFKELLAKHKLRAAAFTVYRTKTWSEGYPAFAKFIGECGGGVVVRESEYGPFPAAELKARMKALLEQLKPEIELAAQNRSCLVIENHGDALLNTLDSLRAFAELNPAPDHLGLGLAPYHLQAIGASVEEAIRICGPQLRFFYGWQRAEGTAQLPGIGPADFTPWIKALAGVDYRGPVSPFMHGMVKASEMVANVRTSRNYLLKCAAQAKTS